LDIERAEAVERDLDAMIERRDRQRRQTEGEREVEELWKAGERLQRARLRERNRWLWVRHLDRLARTLRARAEECERKAEQLMQGEPKGETE
jgi:hypothetical protein